MKKSILTVLILFNAFASFSQNDIQLTNFVADCNTDFWTINADGYIQQWSLSSGVISGGDTILSGGGISLSYCGSSDAPTFYSNDYSLVGISYYDSDSSGWIGIPTYNVVDNNGGHLNDQYYRVEGAVIQIVKYWDGTNLLTIDSLNGEFFAGVADIAVDTMGQAWIFTGSMPSAAYSLNVYNQNGKIRSYSIQQTPTAYGSFFLNDTLYIGTVEDSIFPVIILNDSTAQLGNPISFPSSNFTDMASCQETTSTTTSLTEYPLPEINFFPNPTNGYLTLPDDIERSSISVYNSKGELVVLKFNGKILDLTEQPSGIYFIKISINGRTQFQKVVKN